MAVIPRHYTSFREMETSESLRGSSVIQIHRKPGMVYKLAMEKNKQSIFEVDDYLAAAAPMHGLGTLEPKDAQRVPEYIGESNIIDLSSAMSPILDTPSIIESFVDELPFRFLPDPGFGPPTDIVQAATASAMLALEEETYQDLTEMIVNDKPLSMACSPGPLLSPDESNYSNASFSNSESPNSLVSAASTSNDPRFFAPDFEVLTPKTSSVKDESLVMRCRSSGSSTDVRYSEMRRKNNMASRRSRLSRRDKEREMEQELQTRQEENVSLKAQFKELETLVAKVKAILISVVAEKSKSQAGKQ